MNEGRDRGLWWHTAAVICSLANANRDKRKRRSPYTPSEFHPWEISERKRKTKAMGKDNKFGFAVLKAAFVDQKSLPQIEAEFGV